MPSPSESSLWNKAARACWLNLLLKGIIANSSKSRSPEPSASALVNMAWLARARPRMPRKRCWMSVAALSSRLNCWTAVPWGAVELPIAGRFALPVAAKMYRALSLVQHLLGLRSLSALLAPSAPGVPASRLPGFSPPWTSDPFLPVDLMRCSRGWESTGAGLAFGDACDEFPNRDGAEWRLCGGYKYP